MLNYKYGIQQDRRDFDPLQGVIIEEPQVNSQLKILKEGGGGAVVNSPHPSSCSLSGTYFLASKFNDSLF